MGLIDEYGPAKNNRITNVISKTSVPIASSSVETLGGAFVLLDAKVIQGVPPVRLRLYSDPQSMVTDQNRVSSSFTLNDTVGLIADINLHDTNTLVFNPPVIGNTEAGGQVWYNLGGSIGAPAAVKLTTYTLSDIGDSQESKTTINISGSQVPVTGYGVSGSFTTPKSFLILKAKGLYNFNVDQQWERGNSNDGGDGGWEFFQERALTSELHSKVDPTKVTQQFPEIPVGPTEYAAKVATRTGTFWKDGNFYYLPVDVGNLYRISGWVYGTANDTLSGSYDIGFLVIGTDAGGTLIPDYTFARTAPAPHWQYVSADFSIGAGTSSLVIGTFIDGPYPAGYGYGSPVCDAAHNLQPLVCPGYAWYTGFTVENITDFGSRLRLYSTEVGQVPLTEQTRSFGVAPSLGSNLIVDMMFDSSSLYYPLVPIVEAQTWGSSSAGTDYNVGEPRVGYILENKSNVATVYSGSLNSILNIYSLDD